MCVRKSALLREQVFPQSGEDKIENLPETSEKNMLICEAKLGSDWLMHVALTFLNLVYVELAYSTLVVPCDGLGFVGFVSSNTLAPHRLISLGQGIWLSPTFQVARSYSTLSWLVVSLQLVVSPYSATQYLASRKCSLSPGRFRCCSLSLFIFPCIIFLSAKESQVVSTQSLAYLGSQSLVYLGTQSQANKGRMLRIKIFGASEYMS